MRILDKDTTEGPDAATTMNGTGPFKFVEWSSGDHITMAKNPNYWEPGLPYLNEVNIKVFKDQPAMVVALESGAMDMAFAPPIQDSARLQADPKWNVYNNAELGQYFYMQMNTSTPPTDNKMLRQAIAYALDRQRFTDVIMRGFAGIPKDLPWPTASAAYEADKNNHYTLDLARAKAMVAESGVTNPQFDLAYALAGFSGEYAQLAQVIQQDLAQIGITVTLKPMEIAAFNQAGIGVKPPYTGARLSASRLYQCERANVALFPVVGVWRGDQSVGVLRRRVQGADRFGRERAGRRQAQTGVLEDQRLSAGPGVQPGDLRLPEHPGASAERARPGLLPGPAVDLAHGLAGLRLRAREAITSASLSSAG